MISCRLQVRKKKIINLFLNQQLTTHNSQLNLGGTMVRLRSTQASKQPSYRMNKGGFFVERKILSRENFNVPTLCGEN